MMVNKREDENKPFLIQTSYQCPGPHVTVEFGLLLDLGRKQAVPGQYLNNILTQVRTSNFLINL